MRRFARDPRVALRPAPGPAGPAIAVGPAVAVGLPVPVHNARRGVDALARILPLRPAR